MDLNCSQEGKAAVSLSRKMSKVGLLAAMKTFTKPHFQRKKKRPEGGVKQQSRSWDSGLCHLGLQHAGGGGGQPHHTTLGTIGSYKRIYWPGHIIVIVIRPHYTKLYVSAVCSVYCLLRECINLSHWWRLESTNTIEIIGQVSSHSVRQSDSLTVWNFDKSSF